MEEQARPKRENPKFTNIQKEKKNGDSIRLYMYTYSFDKTLCIIQIKKKEG